MSAKEDTTLRLLPSSLSNRESARQTCVQTYCLVYFGVLKRLGRVEETGRTEPSTIQEYHPPAPDRVYYRLTEKGKEAPDEYWSNPLFTLYPEIDPSHMKR